MNPKTAIDTQVRVRVEHGRKRIDAFQKIAGLISLYTDKVTLYVDGARQS